MKLGEMSFEQSRLAEMKIIPEIEMIMSSEETASLFDDLFAPGTEKKSIIRRGAASKKLVSDLVGNHFDSICSILSVMNGMPLEDIKDQRRSEANRQITELLNDDDLVSFFISPEALGQAIQSAISQK